MVKKMSQVVAGDVVLVKGARLTVESVVAGDPFIHLNIANRGMTVFGMPNWLVGVETPAWDLSTLTANVCNWERTKQYVQLPLPFPQGVL